MEESSLGHNDRGMGGMPGMPGMPSHGGSGPDRGGRGGGDQPEAVILRQMLEDIRGQCKMLEEKLARQRTADAQEKEDRSAACSLPAACAACAVCAAN